MSFLQKKNRDIEPIARRMFVEEGQTCADISRLLKVKVETLYRWRDKGGWREQKELHQDACRDALLALEKKLGQIVSEMETLSIHDEHFSKKTDGLSKLISQIRKLRSVYEDDIKSITVKVMSKYAEFIRGLGLTEEQIEVHENGMSGFFDYVRERY